jgi:outer membrane protein TolC
MKGAVFCTAFIFYSVFPMLVCTTLNADAPQLEPMQDKGRGIKLLENEVIASRQAETKSAPRKKSLKSVDPAWEFIRKQKIDASRPLTLTDFIDMALRNNPQTRQAWENVLVARALRGEAQSSLYPQLSISETVTREKEVDQHNIFTIDDLHYGPSANLTYLLLDFGGRGARIKGALEGILSADAQYNQAIQDLILNTETAYYGLYSAQAALEAAKADVDNAKTDLDAAQQRLDAGLATKLDVLEAK